VESTSSALVRRLVGDRRVALPRAKYRAQIIVSGPPDNRELDVGELVQLQRVGRGDRDALHPTDVDDQAAIERGPAMKAVAPAAGTQGDALLASPLHRVDYILCFATEHDCLG
jgi:hypothetical protein